ncbi:MAG: hypothetical protein Pars92KO_27770 [Parasphingorhabdus sp.]
MSGPETGWLEFSGLLREQIHIERQSSERDSAGSAIEQNDPVGAFRAAAEPLGTGDEAHAGSRSAMPRWRFILRQTNAVRPGDILIWAGREMVVRSVSSDHRFIPRTFLQAEEKRV